MKLSKRDYPNTDPYDTKPGEKPYKMEIVWPNVFFFLYLHITAVTVIFSPVTLRLFLFGAFYAYFCSFGITIGAHRFWAHKSFKVKRPLYLLLLYMQTAAMQECVIKWVRNHRTHHKYVGTNADPHNVNRGFFFSHVGWLLCKKHPDVAKYGQRIDMSDLTSDPWLQFQKKYYVPLVLFSTFVVPTFIGMYFFDAPFYVAFNRNMLRYIIAVNSTFCVNSVCHIWGDKPFEKNIDSTDSIAMGVVALGEGFHNYHHVYPFDYKCSELPYYLCNASTFFIDFFAWLGWAYDLKTVPHEMIRSRVLRTGDGSHRYSSEEKRKIGAGENHLGQNDFRDRYWGWGDGDMLQEDINSAGNK